MTIPDARPGHHRRLATRVQRRTTEEGAERADANRLRTAVDDTDGDGESNRRTLKRSATEGGGTSGQRPMSAAAMKAVSRRMKQYWQARRKVQQTA